MKAITVLLSSYNGAKYLQDQIDSILGQRNVEVNLVVRDDGSSDGTLEVLQQYERYKSFRLIAGANVGPAVSFMNMVYTPSFCTDYYAFADQDDIWMEDKLWMATEALEGEKDRLLYTSNQTVVDENGNEAGLRYDFVPPTDILNIIDKNYLPGCTMVFKKSLADCLASKKPSESLLRTRMHDTWVAAIAACKGTVYYDKNSYIYYRQHGHNVVGAYETPVIIRIKQKICVENRNYQSEMAKEIIGLFGSDITDESKHVLDLYANACSVGGKLKLFNDHVFKELYFRDKFQFILKYLMAS